MKLSYLILINAFAFLAFGIAFALYGPLMMSFFAIPEITGIDVAEYWQIASFARMFGAMLFAFGLLLWAVRGTIDQIESEARRSLVFALVLGYGVATVVSITQQSSIWGSLAGWITTAICAAFTLAYGYFLALKKFGLTQ
jgi:hypothetical protein